MAPRGLGAAAHFVMRPRLTSIFELQQAKDARNDNRLDMGM
jgi:hypothetical protein